MRNGPWKIPPIFWENIVWARHFFHPSIEELTRWWFQIFFEFSPQTLGKMNQFWGAYFSTGWFNHQPVANLRNLPFSTEETKLLSWFILGMYPPWVVQPPTRLSKSKHLRPAGIWLLLLRPVEVDGSWVKFLDVPRYETRLFKRTWARK